MRGTGLAGDADLQTQVNQVSEANLETTLAIHQEAEQRRKDISDIKSEVYDNFEYLYDETIKRETEIETEKSERENQDVILQENLNSEKQARVENDLGLARQVNANAEAILQTGLNLIDVDKRRKEDLSSIDINTLAQKTEGYSGADIEGIVREAVEMAFTLDKSSLTTELLLIALKNTSSLSEIMKESIDKMNKIYKFF